MQNNIDFMIIHYGKEKTKQPSNTKQTGVALIQVLLISAIITLLAIRFSYTAREQVSTATTFEQRIQATQLLQSTQSKMIFTLLTEEDFAKANEIFPMSEPWNFYGKSFYLEQTDSTYVKVSMQDNAGLLPQQFITWPQWKKVFASMGYNEQQIAKLSGEINDWQDRDLDSWLVGDMEPNALTNGNSYRNLPIQLPQEIDNFFNENLVKLHDVKNISMYYPIGGFNLMNAPELLITYLFPENEASEMLSKRAANQLTSRDVIDLLGSQYDDVIYKFFPATQIKLTIEVKLNEIQLQETIEIKLQPRAEEPFLVFSRY
jgi:general secretion pathway protein K